MYLGVIPLTQRFFVIPRYCRGTIYRAPTGYFGTTEEYNALMALLHPRRSRGYSFKILTILGITQKLSQALLTLCPLWLCGQSFNYPKRKS
jgi:hypothetical protein